METKMIRLKEIDSTNRFLKQLDSYDEDALTIAVADYQTAGKGQGSHTWEGEAGKNLLFTGYLCANSSCCLRLGLSPSRMLSTRMPMALP